MIKKEENAYRINSASTKNLLQFLPLPLGEVPRRGGEGVFPLSVTTEGRDSSPRGGAKLSKVDKHKEENS